MAVTRQPFFIANRFGQRLTERNAHVLNGMVGIDMQITARIDLQVDQAMPGNLIEHVIEESYARRQLGLARAFQVELDADLGFQRCAMYVGSARLGHRGMRSK